MSNSRRAVVWALVLTIALMVAGPAFGGAQAESGAGETRRGAIGWTLGTVTSMRGGGHTTGAPAIETT